MKDGKDILVEGLNEEYKGKRITVMTMDGEKHGGLAAYFGTNMFSSHGVIVFFGRCPVYNIDINTIEIVEDPITVT